MIEVGGLIACERWAREHPEDEPAPERPEVARGGRRPLLGTAPLPERQS
ncbi:MAG: hypothetical protein QOK04_943, partial [Solirubrobacteraceae bacterium]|nr:hypothetical protein [Solirubrobacteraceae bacterium]